MVRPLIGTAQALGFAIVVLSPCAARATTFTLDAGSLSLTIDEYSPGVGFYRAADAVTVDLDSVELVFDPDRMRITSLVLAASPDVELALHPGTAGYADGYRTLTIESFGLQANDGAVLGGGRGYAFGDDVWVNASFSVADASGAQLVYDQSAAGVFSGDMAQGPIYGALMSEGPISLTGVGLGYFESPWNSSYLVVTGNFAFSASPSAAPVPEPGAALLFIWGLLVAGLSARSHRSAARSP